jgi:predicted short-subunit dehydrogenase-like oxidoreductase (DUF2520 family)
MNKLKIVLIGSGNVATHFAFALQKKGHEIVQIFSKNKANANVLSIKTNAQATNQLSNLQDNADLYIISVSDKAIAGILSSVDFSTKKVVHTAGSIPLSIFPENIKNAGVFYPFQTFSKDREIDFSQVPLCIEANNPDFEEFLIHLAKQLSTNVQLIDSEKRKYLHLSGVFACNFVNHLYVIAGNILNQQNIDSKIILPLIKETAAKVEKLTPLQAQTGPAVRNDTESLKKHIDLLTSTPEYQEIYKWFSEQIYKNQKASHK